LPSNTGCQKAEEGGTTKSEELQNQAKPQKCAKATPQKHTKVATAKAKPPQKHVRKRAKAECEAKAGPPQKRTKVECKTKAANATKAATKTKPSAVMSVMPTMQDALEMATNLEEKITESG